MGVLQGPLAISSPPFSGLHSTVYTLLIHIQTFNLGKGIAQISGLTGADTRRDQGPPVISLESHRDPLSLRFLRPALYTLLIHIQTFNLG